LGISENRYIKWDFPLDTIFVAIYFLMLIMYRTLEEPRLYLPVVPFVFMYMIRGISRSMTLLRLPHRTNTLIIVILTVSLACNLISLFVLRDFNDDDIYRPDVQQMFSWVKTTIPPEGHYLFFKPKAAALFTGRLGQPISLPIQWDPIGPKSLEDILPFCKENGINWIILNKITENHIISYLQTAPEAHKTWQNNTYTVFRVGEVSQETPSAR
jgi:hypothetical protein